jgi:hypothetical protein
VKFAESFGAHAERVNDPAGLRSALKRSRDQCDVMAVHAKAFNDTTRDVFIREKPHLSVNRQNSFMLDVIRSKGQRGPQIILGEVWVSVEHICKCATRTKFSQNQLHRDASALDAGLS